MATSDNAQIVVGNVGTVANITKQPAEVRLYTWNFLDYLQGRTIVSATVTVEASAFTPPTAGTPTVVGGNKVEVMLSGGAAKYFGRITVTATLDTTEVKEAEAKLTITEI